MNRLADLTKSDYADLQVDDFTRYAGCLLTCKGDPYAASEMFSSRWPSSPHKGIVERAMRTRTKAVVTAPGASNLLPNDLNTAFVHSTLAYGIHGRMAARRGPFQTKVIFSASPFGAAWVGAGLPKPAQAGDLDTVTLPPAKIVGLIVVTAESARLAVAGSVDYLRDELRDGVIGFTDRQLLDPSVAAVAGISPASLTYGVSPVISGGTSAADAVNDFRRLVAAFIAGGGKLEAAVFILSSENAVALNLTGAEAFRGVTREGGLIGGVPVLASSSVGDIVALVDANAVLVADNYELEISSSANATLEMADAGPTQNARTGTGANLVSLWHSNLLGLKVERFVNWHARAGAVALLTGARYYGAGSPA